jgi:hypothetical protein
MDWKYCVSITSIAFPARDFANELDQKLTLLSRINYLMKRYKTQIPVALRQGAWRRFRQEI